MSEPLRILILEDNPADAELAQFELEDAGLVFTSKVVMTEEDFIRALQEFQPDLILSDYDLPKYNGALALAEARRRSPDTPFILVTGAVTEDRAIDILTQGAKDYVLKNRLQQRLGPAVRRALAEAEEHRARKQAEAELREAHRNLEEKVKIRTAKLEADLTALTRIRDMSTKVLEAEGLDSMLQGIMDAAVAIVAAEKGTLQMVVGDSLHIVAHVNHDRAFLDFFAAAENVASVCGEATKRGERVVVSNVETSPLFAGTPSLSVLRKAGVRAVQSTPLISRKGKLLGILTTQWGVPHVPDEQDLWRIDLLARQAADMIDQAQATMALQDSEKRYRRLFESAKDGILILDADTGEVDDVNPFLLRLLGYSYDALCGKHIWEIGVFKDIVASKDAFKALQENEYIRYDDLPLETLDGHPIAVEFVSNVYLVDHHKVVQCNIRDITERKRMEEENQRLLVGAKLERDRLSSLIGSISDEIWFADADKRLTLMNPAVKNEFGSSVVEGMEVEKIAASFEVYRSDGNPPAR